MRSKIEEALEVIREFVVAKRPNPFTMNGERIEKRITVQSIPMRVTPKRDGEENQEKSWKPHPVPGMKREGIENKALYNLVDRDGEFSMKETRYQVIEWDGRYWIVDEGSFAMEKKVTPNLTKGEVKIIRLSVQDCPLKVNCIELEGKPGEEVSSICKYLGKYYYLRATVPCHYDGYFERDLFKLLPEPVTVKAKYAKTQFSPAGIPVKKSHAHLVCEE